VEVAVDLRPIAGPDTTVRRRFRRVTDEILGALEGRAALTDTTYATSLSDTVRTRSGTVGASPTAGSDSARVESARADSAAMAAPDSVRAEGPIVVEIIPTESTVPLDRRRRAVAPGSTFVFGALPEGTFRFRAFHDRNGNGRWDGGLIRPHVPAEPMTWSESTTNSRPRWTNVIPAPLRVPTLRLTRAAPSPPAPAPDSAAVDSASGAGG
jgi:hypothetical protein